MFNANVIYLFARAKSLLYNTTSSDILQINAHKRTPVTRANMMKFRYSIEVVIITYYHAVVKIGRRGCTQWRVLLPFKQKSIIFWQEVSIPFQYVQQTSQVVSFSNSHAISN